VLTLARVLSLPFAGFYGGGSAILFTFFQQWSVFDTGFYSTSTGWKEIQSITLNC
jgi:hypothetical protein